MLRRKKVANIKSAKKRILVNKRQRVENRLVKTSLNTEIKKYKKDLSDGNLEGTATRLAGIESDIMSARSKGVLHANNASRKVARLKLAYAKAQTTSTVAPAQKVEEVKVEEVKVEVKPEVVEKKAEPAKKPAAKKTATKATAKTEEKPATAKTATKKATTKTTAAKTTAAKTTTKKTTAKKDAE